VVFLYDVLGTSAGNGTAQPIAAHTHAATATNPAVMNGVHAPRLARLGLGGQSNDFWGCL
jgi:hypothetical protein